MYLDIKKSIRFSCMAEASSPASISSSRREISHDSTETWWRRDGPLKRRSKRSKSHTLHLLLMDCMYTTIQKFGVSKFFFFFFFFFFSFYWKILFSKDALIWSKMRVKTFIMLPRFSISNKCCSYAQKHTHTQRERSEIADCAAQTQKLVSTPWLLIKKPRY